MESEQGGGIQSAAGDQLAENGLYSPLCKRATLGALSAAAQANCRASGFVAADAPSNDYALDVHIDTGALGIGKGGLLTVVQDLFIAPVWGALEWVVHAMLVLLEWCYTLELLGGATTSTVAGALEHARASFTDPWLALVLSLAAVLALYHGLVRRRVAETLGGALTMLAMMAGGLWVIADPAGTVGAIGRWANQASVGTLVATAGGASGSAVATLGDSMRALYVAVIETPWCYLEFGNVRWCSDPAVVEPSLRAAALSLVAREGAHAPNSSAALVRSATTNGALFLAFPANGPARNSINDDGSLLRAICRGEDATKCSGAAASEAEFRTDGGTLPRVFGLLAILVGALGMVLLFGLLALRLLAGAFMSLLLLLLAPFAVLAPAFGDGGRAVFGGWLSRLLGAVASKLLFSFVLGALLTVQRMLTALDSLGWWTQWLLVSTFWWIVFLKRDQAAAVLRGANRVQTFHPAGSGGERRARHASGGAAERTLAAYGALRHPARWARARVEGRLAPARPLVDGGSAAPAAAGSPLAGKRDDKRLGGLARSGAQEAGERRSAEPQRADGRALGAGDGEDSRHESSWVSAVRPHRPELGSSAHSCGASPSQTDRAVERSDADGARVDPRSPGDVTPDGSAHGAVTPGSLGQGRAGGGGESSDASRAGDGSVVDRATVAGRSIDGVAVGGAAAGRPPGGPPAAGGPDVRDVPERSTASVVAAGGAARRGKAAPAPEGSPAVGASAPGESRSPIMQDAFAVAERRKRQLGFGRP